MQTHRGQDDFLMPAARQLNPYRGELMDPVVSDLSAVSEASLQQSLVSGGRKAGKYDLHWRQLLQSFSLDLPD